jgi:hypothetical protein
MHRYPAFNKACVVCGHDFNALCVKPRTRVTCSKECSAKHKSKLQLANSKQYNRERLQTPGGRQRNIERSREWREKQQ